MQGKMADGGDASGNVRRISKWLGINDCELGSLDRLPEERLI